jgi:hypothetical protein
MDSNQEGSGVNAEVFRIAPATIPALFPEFPSNLLEFAHASDPLLAWVFAGAPLCVAGLCPPTLLSDTAYIWGWNTDLVERHRVIYARGSRRLIVAALKRYPTLIGHCHRRKWRWLYRLGARMTAVEGDMIQFTIGANP